MAVLPFDGLLVHFALVQETKILLKGIRTSIDYEYELQMALTNKRLAPDIESVYLFPSHESSFISSSLIKDIAAHGGDVSSMVTANVVEALIKKREEFSSSL